MAARLLAALALASANPDVLERATRSLKALETAASLATSRVDHPCVNAKQRIGKDVCACQLSCRDLQCSNARASCGAEFKGWCSDMDMNAAKRVEKRVATLKRGGPAWRLDADAAAPFRDLFGAGGAPFVALVGEQKCGTTLVYDALVQSTALRPAANGRKEQHFFDSHHVIDGCRASGYARGLTGGKARGVIDATPDYLADPVAAAHLAFLVPAAKVVALVRDPVKRAHAAWDQNRRSNQEGRSFVQAARAELPVARRCGALGEDMPRLFSSIAGGETAANATLSHGLVEFVERCALFFDGRPRNCWVDKTYAQRGACKRYLYKGFYGDHLGVYAALFPRAQVAVLRAERVFDAATKGPALQNLFAFLGYGAATRVVSPEKKCWHDCGQKKRAPSSDVPEALAADLDALYAASNARLDALLASGAVTAL